MLTDDDVEAPAGWLQALLDGARAYPGYEVFGGPIRARLERTGPPACGREPVPVTNLDLGSSDVDAELVWSANMAIRAGALARVGPFDERIHGRGEEDEWERRYAAAGGRIRYLAAAGLDHRRARGRDAAPAVARRLRARAHRAAQRRSQGPVPLAPLGARHAGRVRLAHRQAPLRDRGRDGGGGRGPDP